MCRIKILLFVSFLIPAATHAQADPNTHQVAGRVEDPSGLPTPNAVVSLKPANASRTREFSTTTEPDGSFRFDSVPRGRYSLEAALEGFTPYQREIAIRRNRTALRIELRIEQLSEQVTVESRQPLGVSTERAENVDAVEIDRNTLDRLPVLDQDVVAAASQFLDDDALGSEGATLVVDGIETDAIGVTSSAIEEVRVNKDPYSAEFSRPGRGRIEVITKQGSSEYHGSLNFGFRDYRLDARNAFATERPKQLRRRLEGHISGPIGRSGKNTFLLSAERDLDDEQSIVFAQTPNGIVNQTFPRPERETEFSGRFNRYGNKHSWSARYALEKESEEGSGVGGFDLPEVASNEREDGHRVYFSHKWFASPKWLTDFSARVGRESERTESARPGEPRIVVLDSFTGGGAQQSEQANETDLELSFVASWSGGNHFVRTGFLVPDLSRQSVNQRDNFDGTFQFASLEAYEARNPFSFTQRQGDSRVTFWARQFAGFIQDDIRLTQNIKLGLGLRYDWQNFLSDGNNFAPRASLAWAFGKDRKTVVRTGAGIFYDRMGSWTIQDVLLFNGRRLREVIITDPGFPDPSAGTGDLSELPPSVVRFSPFLRNPYVTQYNAGVERELMPSMTLALNYVGVRGVKLFRSLDRNAPVPPNYIRPDATLAEVREIESAATLKSHSLNLDLRTRFKLFRGGAGYRLGRSYDDTPGRDDLPPNSLDLRGQWARADFDRRHSLRLLGTVELPAGVGLGAIFIAGSGRPYEWTTGRDTNQDGRAAERPAGVSRNALEGPGEQTLDVRLSREFQIGKQRDSRTALTVKVDAFNVLNKVNFDRIVGNESSPFFGRPVAAESARRMQLSVELSF